MSPYVTHLGVSLSETYHLNTNELILETAVRGQPTPEVQWFKDSIEIQSGGRYQLIEHQDGTRELIIDRPDSKDSGKYVLKAESRAGKMEISHYVLFEGQAHHISDNIHGVFHADKSLLRPKEVEKPVEKKPAPAPAAAEPESEAEDGKTKKRGRKEEDDSSAYATDYASDTASLSSKRREKNIAIHFSTSMRDRVVAEGSKVKISCFLEAKEPQVKWFKDGEQIQNSPKIRGRYSEGLCLLEITSATAEDNGEYKCWGRDETGEASTSCRLEVYEDPGTGDVPPTFTRNIKDTMHGKINELQLDVHVRGLPTPYHPHGRRRHHSHVASVEHPVRHCHAGRRRVSRGGQGQGQEEEEGRRAGGRRRRWLRASQPDAGSFA